MNRPLAFAIVSAVLAGGSHALADQDFTPLAGRDVVKPIKPDWCADAQIDDNLQDSNPQGPLDATERAVGSGYSEGTLRRIAKVACMRPNDPTYQQAIAKWRQGYVNLIGTSETQDRANMKVRVSASWEKQKKDWCESIKPGDEASLEEQAMGDALSAGTGCEVNGRGGQPLDLASSGWTGAKEAWWVDTRAEVSSQIVRAVYLTRCLRFLDDRREWSDPKRTVVMAGYAGCGPDARRLDPARLEQELTDAKFNDYARLHARETFAQAKTVTDTLTAEYQRLAAKDEGYKKLLFDAPEAAWSQWGKDYETNKEAFEAAKAYEKKFYGSSKKALQGCGAALRKNFSAYIKSKKPKTADQAKQAALDPIGYNLLVSLMACDGVEGRFLAAQAEGEFLDGDGKGKLADRRGPRLEASYAAMRALGEILADRDKFPVKASEFRSNIIKPAKDIRDGATQYYENHVHGPGHNPAGTLATVKKGADGTLVTFKSVSITVPNVICKPNGRIDRITSSGEVLYDKDCHREGNVTLTDVEKPLLVGPEVADGLKAGLVGVFSGDATNDQKRLGFPREVYGDKEMKKLLIWFGVAL